MKYLKEIYLRFLIYFFAYFSVLKILFTQILLFNLCQSLLIFSVSEAFCSGVGPAPRFYSLQLAV